MLSSYRKDSFHFIPTYKYKEYWLPLINAIVICIIGTFPYLYGYYIAGEDRVFMGMVGRGTHASYGYIMFQRQAMEGKTWQRNQCTPENLPNRYFNIEWWLMGRLARWSGLTLIQIHHIDRIISVFLLTFTVYYFLCVVLGSLYQRIFAFLLIVYGSGLGWIIWLVNFLLNTHYPYTWDIQGVQVFGYMINKPHFIRGFVFGTLMFAYLIRGYQTGKFVYFILSGLAGLIHLIIRPHYAPETFIIYLLLPAIYCWTTHKLDKKLYLYSVIALAIHIPAFIYYAWLDMVDPLGIKMWTIKYEFLAKPGFLIEYIIGIGWTFLCCVIFLPYLLKQAKTSISVLMLLFWIFVTWFVCNLYPFWKLGQEAGFHVFYVASPALAIGGTWNWIQEKVNINEKFAFFTKKWVIISVCCMLFIVSIPTTAYVYINMFTSIKNGHPIWTYTISKDTYDALRWLNENTPEDSIVLATHRTSQFIFAETHCKTVTGNQTLTINFSQKNAEVERFFAEVDCDIFQRYLLNKYNVDYVLFGPYAKQLSGNIIPSALRDCELVFRKGDTEIYHVKR